MVVDELIEQLQKLSLGGYGGHQVMMVLNTSEQRVGFLSRLVAPSPEKTDSDGVELEALDMPWLIAEPTDVDGTPYAPEYLFE